MIKSWQLNQRQSEEVEGELNGSLHILILHKMTISPDLYFPHKGPPSTMWTEGGSPVHELSICGHHPESRIAFSTLSPLPTSCIFSVLGWSFQQSTAMTWWAETETETEASHPSTTCGGRSQWLPGIIVIFLHDLRKINRSPINSRNKYWFNFSYST